MRKRTTVAAALVAATGITGAAIAGIPAPDGSIQGCYGSNGQLRVIDSGESCRRPETAIRWNRTGPEGPAGPRGERGPQGPQGEAGPQGPAGDTLLSSGVVLPGGGRQAPVGPQPTVTRTGTGRYRLEMSGFGTQCTFPTLVAVSEGVTVATPFGTCVAGGVDATVVTTNHSGARVDVPWAFVLHGSAAASGASVGAGSEKDTTASWGRDSG